MYIKGGKMLILNVIVLMIVAFAMGYAVSDGKIVINRVANKTDSKRLVEIAEESARKQQEAIEEFENEFKDL
jgi:hypothetical protein